MGRPLSPPLIEGITYLQQSTCEYMKQHMIWYPIDLVSCKMNILNAYSLILLNIIDLEAITFYVQVEAVVKCVQILLTFFTIIAITENVISHFMIKIFKLFLA